MSQPVGLSDCSTELCQCLVWEPEAEKHNPQIRLRIDVRVESDLMDKRTAGNRIVKRKHLFQMGPGQRKFAGETQVRTGRGVTQNEPGGIVALTAQAHQILVQALCRIELSAVHVIARLSIGHRKKL